MMKISIFGLGYVGIVSACCLAARGHKIIGVDISDDKINMLNKGVSPIVEKDVQNLLSDAIRENLIYSTSDVRDAILNSAISIICVGTPSRTNGSLNTYYLEKVCKEISIVLKEKDGHVLNFRSTMLPGTMNETIIPLLEKESKKKEGKDFYVAFNPEFLREATAVEDFNNPPKTVIGCNNTDISDKIMKMYAELPGPKIKTSLEVAEMVKYVDNNFHALKVTFANEVGRLCHKIGIDSHEVMDIFVQDCKLNISPYYLKPGFAFGGSCLPKDLRAINYLAQMKDLELPVLESILQSNEIQILSLIKRIVSTGKKKIGIAGFSFKAGTDDLRESPLVEVIETLLGKGYDLKLYDENVAVAKLVGANKKFINDHIPYISSLIVKSIDELLKDRELIIIGNADNNFKKILEESRDDQIVIDLVRIGDISNVRDNYQGICW